MNKISFSNQPRFQILSREQIEQIYHATLDILNNVGIVIYNDNGLKILKDAGADVDIDKRTAKIPEQLVKESIMKSPSSIRLYSRDRKHDVILEENKVYFTPGGSSLNTIDMETGEYREVTSQDMVDSAKLVDALEYILVNYALCRVNDVPEIIADRYRTYLTIKNTSKPICVSYWTTESPHDLKRMGDAIVGDRKDVRKPFFVVPICPSPPLKWADLACSTLIDSAKYGIPVCILPEPSAGATSPVTLAANIAQLTAENLSGIVMAQLVNPGAPIIFGGIPYAFDMRRGTYGPFGDICRIMLTCGYAEVAKYLNLLTGAWLCITSSKIFDAQMGFESGIGAVLGALAGINLIAGPGMNDESSSTNSCQKLIIDNEICGMVYRLLEGINVSEDTLALNVFERVGPGGYFLTEKHTLEWFRKEIFMPSDVIDRDSLVKWRKKGSKDIAQRARERAKELLEKHEPEPLPDDAERELDVVMREIAKRYGVKKLPLGPDIS